MATNNSTAYVKSTGTWMLYIAGRFYCTTVSDDQVPVLAFCIRNLLPQEINTPLLVGGLIAHYVSTRSKDEELNNVVEKGEH